MSRTCFVTGTRKGIGRAIAEHLLGKDDMVIGCSRSAKTINHSNYTHYQIDVADETSVTQTVRKIRREFGAIDVLINNAGVAAMNSIVLTPQQSVSHVINTNVVGTFNTMREVAKVMMRQSSGRIVNFSTIAVPLSLEGEAVYASSKAAIESLTKVSARELAPWNITVNAIGPTPINTDLIKVVPREKIDNLIARQGIKRMGETRDVLNVIDFFVSADSDFISGQVLYLGGI